MGVREPHLTNPFRCIYGNKVGVALTDEYIAACYDRDDFLAPLPEVADVYVSDFSEDLTRAWLFARVFAQGYYDAYKSNWRTLSRDHPVWDRIRDGEPQGVSFREAAGVLTPSAPEGYVRSEGEVYVKPSQAALISASDSTVSSDRSSQTTR